MTGSIKLSDYPGDTLPLQCAKPELCRARYLLDYYQFKNRIIIASGNPLIRSLDIKATDPNIHVSEMAMTLLFGKTKVRPLN